MLWRCCLLWLGCCKGLRWLDRWLWLAEVTVGWMAVVAGRCWLGEVRHADVSVRVHATFTFKDRWLWLVEVNDGWMAVVVGRCWLGEVRHVDVSVRIHATLVI